VGGKDFFIEVWVGCDLGWGVWEKRELTMRR